MIQELGRAAQEGDTLPLWALRPMPRRAPPSTTAEEPPLLTSRARRQLMGQPSERQRAADRLLSALVVLFVLLNLADLISTFVGLQSGLHEGNPLMSALLSRYGFSALVLYKLIVIAAVAVGVRMLRSFRISVARVTIVICNLLVLAVVVANVAQYFLRA